MSILNLISPRSVSGGGLILVSVDSTDNYDNSINFTFGEDIPGGSVEDAEILVTLTGNNSLNVSGHGDKGVLIHKLAKDSSDKFFYWGATVPTAETTVYEVNGCSTAVSGKSLTITIGDVVGVDFVGRTLACHLIYP